jgi:hypothetical protein
MLAHRLWLAFLLLLASLSLLTFLLLLIAGVAFCCSHLQPLLIVSLLCVKVSSVLNNFKGCYGATL